MRKILPSILIFFLFFTLFFLFFDRSLFTGNLLFTERDLSIFFIPPRYLWQKAIKQGMLPLWNPYFYCGYPLFATLQPAILYPINLLLLILPFSKGYNLSIILHFPLSAIFFYIFLGLFFEENLFRLAGAISFSLSGYMLSVHNLIPHLFSVTWVPLILYLFLKGIDKGEKRYVIVSSIICVISFFGGGVEIIYGTFILLLFFSLSYNPKPKNLYFFLIFSILFLSLSAIQSIPFLELSRNCIRKGGLSFSEATTWSLDYKDFVQFFLPDPFGYAITREKYWANQSWLKTIYIGILPFSFAIYYLFSNALKKWIWISPIILSLIISLGKNTPLYKFFYEYLPFFNKLRYPVKFMFIFFIFLSIIFCFGLKSYMEDVKKRETKAKKFTNFMFFLAFFSSLLFFIIHIFHSNIVSFAKSHNLTVPDYNDITINLHNIKRLLLFSIFYGVFIKFGEKFLIKKKLFLPTMLFIFTLDLFFANKGYYATTDTVFYFKPQDTIEFIKKDKTIFRIFTSPKTKKAPVLVATNIPYKRLFCEKEKILPGYNLLFDIFCVDGCGVMRLYNFEKLRNLIYTSPSPSATDLLSIMNMKYLISLPEVKEKDYKLCAKFGYGKDEKERLKIYENLSYLKRAYLVNNYLFVKDDPLYFRFFKNKLFSPKDTVLLADLLDVSCKDLSKGSAKIVKYSLNEVVVDTYSPKKSILFLSDTFYPGWRVFVDGHERKILKADFCFRAVLLPEGKHRVKFIYIPDSLILGASITIITIFSLFLYSYKGLKERFF